LADVIVRREPELDLTGVALRRAQRTRGQQDPQNACMKLQFSLDVRGTRGLESRALPRSTMRTAMK
jgi:hypothetical protein